MNVVYIGIDFADLRGDLVEDYLIAVDAELTIEGSSRVIYKEPGFPVVEPARSLLAWIDTFLGIDFEFESLSSDALGIVTVSRKDRGWYMYSSSTPEVRSSPMDWKQVVACVRTFARAVGTDLCNHGADADRILGRGWTEEPSGS